MRAHVINNMSVSSKILTLSVRFKLSRYHEYVFLLFFSRCEDAAFLFVEHQVFVLYNTTVNLLIRRDIT